MNKEIKNNLPLNIIDILTLWKITSAKFIQLIDKQKVLPFIVIKIQT